MKAKYIQPETFSIDLHSEAPILCGSKGISTNDQVGNQMQLSKKNIWNSDNWSK